MNEYAKDIFLTVTEKSTEAAGKWLGSAVTGIPEPLISAAVTIFNSFLGKKLSSHGPNIAEIAESCIEASKIPENQHEWIKKQLIIVLKENKLDAQKLVDDPGYIADLSKTICDRDFQDGIEKEEFSRALQLSLCILCIGVRSQPAYQQALEVYRQRVDYKLQKVEITVAKLYELVLEIYDTQNAMAQRHEELRQDIYYANSFASIIDNIAAPVPSTNRFHYTNEKIAFIGRERELRTLYAFLETDAPIQWMVVTGDGGVGKSRLLYQFSQKLNEDPHWKAVWLKGSMIGKLCNKDEWTYPENLLFIVDYAGAKAKELGKWIYSLSGSNARPSKVRFVLIEREFCRDNDPEDVLPWVRSFYGEGGQRCLKELRYASGLRLNGFTDEEAVSIIRAYAHAEDREISDSDAEVIYEKAKTLDEKKVFPRPLIILFLVDAYLKDKDFHHWDVNTLVENIINNYEDYWKKQVCGIDEDLFRSLQKMLVYATAAGGWNAEDALDEPLKEDADRIRSLDNRGTLLSQINETEEDSDSLHPFEPDMIGECYVLRYLQNMLVNNKTKLQKLVKLLWERFDFAVFLDRCISDYSVNPDFGRLFANEMEALKPDNDEHSLWLYAMLLVNLSAKQSAEEAEATVEKLQALRAEHPANEEITVQYAKGLVNLSAEQSAEERQATVGKLKVLSKKYPDNEEIAVQYAKGLSILNARLLIEALNILIDVKEDQLKEHPDADSIIERNLQKLNSLQSINASVAPVEKLKDLSEKYSNNKEISVLYADACQNLKRVSNNIAAIYPDACQPEQ